MKFRVARHCKAINPIIDFYTKNLGLEVLGSFKSHNNYDGIFLGKKNLDWHLEFTVSGDLPNHYSDEDDLLVFYVRTEMEFKSITNRFKKNGVAPEKPKNPYWNKNAITYCDPDGFRVVVSLREDL
ncbi:MAG: VOC family protein [Saprospiraceae bacterium]|nr:VOC family protein [Saprospiraceae bacterium]